MGARDDIPRRLPRGAHGLGPELVAASQRARLLEAVGQLVAERGYAASTIGQIVGRAGVSRQTFYEHFADKEECFLAAYGAASDECLAQVLAAHRSQDDWLEQTRAGIHTYLRWLAAEPALARVFLVEVLAAGPKAAERRAQMHERYAEMIAELHAAARRERPALPELPPEIFQAAVAATDELVSRRIRAGLTRDLPQLEGILLYLQLSLLAGPEVAAGAAG
jgi:AcrR family transcriptional regulator